jgi:hypothetical protein
MYIRRSPIYTSVVVQGGLRQNAFGPADVLQSGDHLVSVWPPGETAVEGASQCDGTASLWFRRWSPASSG